MVKTEDMLITMQICAKRMNEGLNWILYIMGDKLLLNFGAKFQYKYIISQVKLQNYSDNVFIILLS